MALSDIILASASPRRRELMGLITENFSCIESHVPEICPPGTSALEECQLFARQKCEAVAATVERCVSPETGRTPGG